MESKIPFIKVFFDADAIIAGSASKTGAAFVLLPLSELGLIQGFISQKATGECRKNLQFKLPHTMPSFEKIIESSLTLIDDPPEQKRELFSKMAHEKDVLILAAAAEIRAEFIVTFNTKDFLPSV